MENENRKIENKKIAESGVYFPEFQNIFSPSKNCAACGTANRRETARFCDVCGKSLDEGYEPLDNLRASYRLQGKTLNFEAASEKPDSKEIENLFEREDKNPFAQTAWACLVYSLVPYLGILFVPLTFAISSLAYFNAVSQPESNGKKLSLVSFYTSFAVLTIQIFLWWLLYFVPSISRL